MRLFCIAGGLLLTLKCLRQHRTFPPLDYLAMGKNVFSQINDMFIQKEVTTLFRSCAASKFGGKKKKTRERRQEGFSFVAKGQHKHKTAGCRRLGSASNPDQEFREKVNRDSRTWPGPSPLCPHVEPPSMQTIRICNTWHGQCAVRVNTLPLPLLHHNCELKRYSIHTVPQGGHEITRHHLFWGVNGDLRALAIVDTNDLYNYKIIEKKLKIFIKIFF